MSPSTPVHSSSSLSWQSMAITLVPTPHIHAHTHTHIRTLMYTCSHTQTQSAEYTSVSPLWALACFRKHFYMRLGICWLHVFVQGVFKSTVLAILRPLSAGELRSTPHTYLYSFTLLYDVILEVNERLQTALQDHPSFSKAYGSLFYKGQNKAGDTVTKMGKCGGPILYSVSQVIIACLTGY